MKKALALLLPLLLLLATGEPLGAQQTWIVDLLARPGYQFREIRSAILAASAGDTILVRPATGSYQGFEVTKGLRIVGGADVFVRARTVGAEPAIFVRDVPAGEVVVLSGLVDLGNLLGEGGLLLSDNAGAVHLEEVDSTHPTLVFDSAQVSFQRCDLWSGYVSGSEALFTECSLTGYPTGFDINPALEVTDEARVTIAGGVYTGGEGLTTGSAPAHAIELGSGSTLHLTGDFATTVRAGTTLGSRGAPALLGFAGTSLVLDPDPALVPTPGFPAISGGGDVTTTRIPYLHAELDGGALTTTVETWPGATVRLYDSPFTPPFSYAPTLPDVWVGLPRLVTTATVPASGASATTFALPPLAPGLAFPMQALVLRGGQVHLSNAVVTLLADGGA